MASPPVETDVHDGRLPAVTCVLGERLLVVPVRDGGCAIEDALALNPAAAQRWRERPDGEGAGSAAPTGVTTLEVEDVVTLARAVLAAGHALRFRAGGHSMRPQIPDGSLLEIVAAGIDDVRPGQVVFYTAPPGRLVAHRVVGRSGAGLRTRGDSAPRIDEVGADALLGVVVARIEGDRRLPLDGGAQRVLGRASGGTYSLLATIARWTVVRPLRTLPFLRRLLSWVCRVVSGCLRRAERAGARLRRRVDVTRSALLSTEEKDEGRRRLYARRATVEFTALDENVEAGLTLIEEVLVRRHPPRGARTLVLGCGPGRECVALARMGQQVVGLDREDGMLEHARALADREGLSIDFVRGDAAAFDVPGERFDTVALFSGLYNMVVPRARRVGMLEAARRHLAPGGRVLLTFLSDYVPPGTPAPRPKGSVLRAIQPEHEDGDLYLLNEVVHIFPHPDLLVSEAREAGFRAVEVFRDQRAYDRETRQVRGYAVLEVAPAP